MQVVLGAFWVVSDDLCWLRVRNIQVGVLRNIGEDEFWRGASEKKFKNREIICSHGETGRNKPKWGGLPVGWRETVCLQIISMRWFQPQLTFIYCCQKSGVIFFCGLISSF